MGSSLHTGHDHHIPFTVGNVVIRRGVGDARASGDAQTWVVRGVRDCVGIGARTQVLSKLVASRVLAHFIDGHRMAATMNLEGHLSTLLNRHFLWSEMVVLIGARIRGAADGAGLQARRWANRPGW